MRAERDALLADLAQIVQAENLKTTRVGENRPLPRHEPVQPAHPSNRFDPRPQKKMIGIRKQNLDAKLFQHILRNALNRTERSHRHEHRRLNFSMRSDEPASASSTAGGFNLQTNRHGAILTEFGSHGFGFRASREHGGTYFAQSRTIRREVSADLLSGQFYVSANE